MSAIEGEILPGLRAIVKAVSTEELGSALRTEQSCTECKDEMPPILMRTPQSKEIVAFTSHLNAALESGCAEITDAVDGIRTRVVPKPRKKNRTVRDLSPVDENCETETLEQTFCSKGTSEEQHESVRMNNKQATPETVAASNKNKRSPGRLVASHTDRPYPRYDGFGQTLRERQPASLAQTSEVREKGRNESQDIPVDYVTGEGVSSENERGDPFTIPEKMDSTRAGVRVNQAAAASTHGWRKPLVEEVVTPRKMKDDQGQSRGTPSESCNSPLPTPPKDEKDKRGTSNVRR
ncbi:hypothetical protein BC832DRAFT_542496 [Gaertneriomyces semiglobifer]|nr:hypothetical protein BC832DRAFT_542496 [Gaertneriomyces semiglobifer]